MKPLFARPGFRRIRQHVDDRQIEPRFQRIQFLAERDRIPVLAAVEQDAPAALSPRSARVRMMLIIGVMPTPPAISTCMSAGLRSMVNAPYGPSR